MLKGSRQYYIWLGCLTLFILPWFYGSYTQFTQGMVVTGLTDQVSWGIYVANFIFLVGVAAGAVTIVFPAYVYNFAPLKKIAVLGEMLAISAVIVCLLFIVFHMGRPDRLWHMIPGVGIYNFPYSILAWDTLVLTGYFILNAVGACYFLYKRYRGEKINYSFYLPLIFVSIFWAVSIHTVTAFLLSTLPARPMWHHGIMPIRFIATAFAAGPAAIVVVFLVIRSNTKLWIEDKAIDLLSTILVFSLALAIFLAFSEVVTAFYHPTEHASGLRYLMFGAHGVNGLVLWFWTSAVVLTGSCIALMFPSVRKNYQLLPFICALVFVGVWIEKGLCLVIPGSVPTPIGEYLEYSPSYIEIMNSLGNWAIGLIIMTLLIKGAIGVLLGEISGREVKELSLSEEEVQ
ncbi:NrfD/PsrC family molybdoenzyme membrane anchor subunit [Teredinibacter sp. KSP-S5-2]|uniref:NrfD/PsrC family molybdoenzyme membrane anchor subunit n=1 Tax=Teredinibacter sp. KSP-S5-2 TaxID=3034506 RepID=UPI002934DFB5|nr:NrfD/PsrC family molybdoenzyme membrane anchor subunit [Teredinibacter sp. KSP-S5-2]WNO09966.1 polysulfide reductase NrfD [Teredinibacter sp. KSP-S5-2]